MATTSDLSRGAFIRFNGELCQVLEYEHRTPGNLRAFYQVKMRNVKSGKLVENRFRAGEAIELVRVEIKNYQYLYKEGTSLVCMDTDTYDQIYVDEHLFGDSQQFLKEGMEVMISFDGDLPIHAECPASVELEVTYTEPGLKGDTATKTLKPATLETGAVVSVPLFIDIGEKIKVDTRTGTYLERVKE
ncbi:MAG TPA: elongation factor P [Cytophagaceae bacterium]